MAFGAKTLMAKATTCRSFVSRTLTEGDVSWTDTKLFGKLTIPKELGELWSKEICSLKSQVVVNNNPSAWLLNISGLTLPFVQIL